MNGEVALAPLPDFTCRICGGHEFEIDFEHQHRTDFRNGVARIILTGMSYVTLRCACGCWIKYVRDRPEGVWREVEGEIVLRTA